MEPLAPSPVIAFMCTGPDRCAGLVRIAAVLLVVWLAVGVLLLVGSVRLFLRARSQTGERATRTKRWAYLSGAAFLLSHVLVASWVVLAL